MFEDSGCVAVENTADVCGEAIPPGAPVDLCRVHLIQAYLFIQQELAEVDQQTVLPGMRPAPERDDRENVVYYLRFGDRIKIGTTKSLRVRLAHLPHDELLAVEPGGYDVESSRHRQFRAHRISGEWFHAHDELTMHAARIREEHIALLAEAAR